MMKRIFKLLVADDEYWIREKFRNALKWEEYDIQFLEPAENGEEVLNRLQTEACDILITDINMPFVDGVELIGKVKELYPKMVVFVVSGYDDFEYVKDSLMAGAVNYLLKPVNKIDLVSAVSKALEILAKEEENRNRTLKAASLIKDRELSILVEREPAVFAPSIVTNEKESGAGCSLLLIKIHMMQELMEKVNYDMNLLSYEIKERIRSALKMEDLFIFNYIFRSNEFIIVSELEMQELRSMAQKIVIAMKEETSSPITVAVSEHNYSMDSLHDAYLQAVSVLMTRPFRQESSIVFFNKEKKATQKTLQNYLPTEKENQLKVLFQSGNEKALKQLLWMDTGLAEAEKEEWTYLEVKQTAKRICNLLLECASRTASLADMAELEDMADYADRVVEQLSLPVLERAFDSVLSGSFPQEGQKEAGSIRDMVHKATKYIDEHYHEEISLTSMSEMFNVESTYFSKMFKQENGKGMMQYVTEKRVERAKEYMRQEELNITEVAFLVGYDDYTYFNKVFKKLEGMSPRQYKQTKISK